jgi:translocator protein
MWKFDGNRQTAISTLRTQRLGFFTGVSNVRQGSVLLGLIVLCLAAGALGAAVTAPAIPTWYAGLAKPSFNPPNWIFAPVWTALYVLMAIAAWLVWRRGNARPPLTLFGVQLALNSAWSLLFFGLHRVDLALVDIVLLLAAIVATARAFHPRSAVAALLLVPYLAWVSFATVLNFAIWRLN